MKRCEHAYELLSLLRCNELQCSSVSVLCKGDCMTESKFQWFKGDEKPWMESSFIFLFGHVCWAGGFHANNSSPVYSELEVPDRDEVHRAGEKVVMGCQTWEDSLSELQNHLSESAIYLVNWLRSNSWADSSGEETMVTTLIALNHTRFAADHGVQPAPTVPAIKHNTELHPALKTKTIKAAPRDCRVY